jgi:Glycosyltransferase family 87
VVGPASCTPAGGANTAAGGANTAAGGANTASGCANTAAGGANTPAGGGNTSAGAATTAAGIARVTAWTTGGLAVALVALALGTAAWLYVRYPGVLVSGVANTDPKGHVDFETFWRSTVALLHGADIYRTGAVLPNLNPPLLSLLLAPFGLLPVLPSYWAFTALTVLLATGSVLVTARELRLGRVATAFGVLTLWASSPLHGTLLLGQIYGLLLAGLTLAWLAQRRGREHLSAGLLGVTVALKPSLAPLLLVPAARRRWRAFWAGVGLAALSSLLGVLGAGLGSAEEWLRLATGTPAPEVDANASLPGLVARLGGPGALGWAVTVAVVAASVWWTRCRAPGADTRRAAGCADTRRADVSTGAVRSGGARMSPGVVGADGGGVVPGAVEPGEVAIFAVTAGCLLAAPIAWLNYEVMLWPGALVLLRAGRWRAAVPLLMYPVIPVAWGNLWQAAPTTAAALAGRSLYCAVLLGFWIALLGFARGYPARPAAPGAGDGGSVAAGSVTPDPGTSDPATSAPATSARATSARATSDPVTSARATSDPAVSDRATSDRVISDSVTSDGTTSGAGSTAETTGSASGSQRSQSTPTGGTRTVAEAGRPCHGSSVAVTQPRLPIPEPP